MTLLTKWAGNRSIRKRKKLKNGEVPAWSSKILIREVKRRETAQRLRKSLSFVMIGS